MTTQTFAPRSLLRPGPTRAVLTRSLLLALSGLALAGCSKGGGDPSTGLLNQVPTTPAAPSPAPPAVPSPPAPPAPAPTPTAFTPAATVSQTPTLTLQQQDGSTTAGAQVSTSPNFTLISEGVSQ